MIPKISSKKRPSINLSLFINNLSETFSSSSSSDQASKSPNSNKSPKRTFDGGVVGLGIVAAMDEIHDTQDGISSAKTTRVAKMAIPSRSEPIPIVFAKPIVKFRDPILEKYEMGELSESYTCVISHLGNGNSNKRREFFDVSGDRNGGFGGISKSGVFFTSPLKNIEAGSLFGTADFLSCCYLCSKKLQGLDIFMYRGEKAFCSAECRMKHISIDEHRAKCGSGKLKSYAYSVSPCSTPQIFSGVTAA